MAGRPVEPGNTENRGLQGNGRPRLILDDTLVVPQRANVSVVPLDQRWRVLIKNDQFMAGIPLVFV